MKTWAVTYRDMNCPCMTWTFQVEAPDEERAIIRAGMARGDQTKLEIAWLGLAIGKFNRNWVRESVVEVDADSQI